MAGWQIAPWLLAQSIAASAGAGGHTAPWFSAQSATAAGAPLRFCSMLLHPPRRLASLSARVGAEWGVWRLRRAPRGVRVDRCFGLVKGVDAVLPRDADGADGWSHLGAHPPKRAGGGAGREQAEFKAGRRKTMIAISSQQILSASETVAQPIVFRGLGFQPQTNKAVGKTSSPRVVQPYKAASRKAVL